MKKSALAIAIPVAVIGIAVAGAWFTGGQVEPMLKETVAQTNARLKLSLSGTPVSMELLSVERGWFATDARYRITWIDTREGGVPRTFEVRDHLEHGPFPLSRVMHGRLLPVMAESRFHMEPTAFTQRWFDAANNDPVEGQVSLGYDRNYSGVIRVNPVKFQDGDNSVDIAGAEMSLQGPFDGTQVKMQGTLPNLAVKLFDAERQQSLEIHLEDLKVNSDKRDGTSGLPYGQANLTAKRLAWVANPGLPVTLTNLSAQENSTEQAGVMDQRVTYSAEQLNVHDQDLGRLNLAVSAHRLDGAALRDLLVQYNQALAAQPEFRDKPQALRMTPEQQAAVRAQFERLLAGRPQLSIDELSLTSKSGQARLNLAVDFQPVGEDAVTLPALVQRLLAGIALNLVVDKPFIGDMAKVQGAWHGITDTAELERNAEGAVNLLSGMAVNTQWAKAEGNSLHTQLDYSDGKVMLNGQAMTVPQFFAFVGSFAPGMR